MWGKLKYGEYWRQDLAYAAVFNNGLGTAILRWAFCYRSSVAQNDGWSTRKWSWWGTSGRASIIHTDPTDLLVLFVHWSNKLSVGFAWFKLI